jgi:hypothetical protein
MSIAICDSAGCTPVASWPHGTEPADADVRALAALMGQMDVGAW